MTPFARRSSPMRMSALSAPRILNDPVFCRFSSFRYTSRPARPESASDFSVGVRRLCGAIAAAASVTAVASSSRVFTAVMLPAPRPRAVSVRCLSAVGGARPVAAVVGLVAAMQIVGVVEELHVPRRMPHPCQQHRGVAKLLGGVRLDMEHVVPERVALFRRRHDLARLKIERRGELV